MAPDFSKRLIVWQQQHGRHTLPWQNTRDPYAIWVSEIMLQQTQVAAVIPYYQRFMARFPDVAALAFAGQDAVLEHWSGLGYYSRARNLHAAAGMLVEQYGGVFPENAEAIRALPGIGRSTAAAICAFAFGHRLAILDGNVKRVFARFFGVAGWPGQPSVEKKLWEIAESLLPGEAIAAYTQGLMDLGATVCTRARPRCMQCPVASDCVALREDRVAELPMPKPRKALPEKEAVMLVLLNGGEILLEKRPPSGIWGGLWSFPELAPGMDVQQYASQHLGLQIQLLEPMASLTHVFSHFRLHMHPQPAHVLGTLPQLQQNRVVWLGLEDALGAALPAPVRVLISRLKQGL